MASMREAGARPGKAASPSGNGRAGSEPAREGILGRVGGELAGGARELRILSSVAQDRMRLRLRRSLEELQGSFLTTLAATTLVVAGLVLFGLGLAGAGRALFPGRPWLGELLAGALLLLAAGIGLGVRRARRERAEIERLAAKYARMEGGSKDEPDRSASPDGRGAAREH